MLIEVDDSLPLAALLEFMGRHGQYARYTDGQLIFRRKPPTETARIILFQAPVQRASKDGACP